MTGIKTEANRSLTYRADIDGLRAISVLFVVTSHLFDIEAGNVGVDIFFVISGYLITTILLKEHQKGTYSLKNFYVRRVKRIFPVLYISIAIFLLIAFIQFGQYLKLMAKYAICSILMCLNLCVLNFYKIPNIDRFFGKINLMSPNWSLGVQEQFYLFWPLILAFIIKKQHKKKFAITSYLTLISLLLRTIPFPSPYPELVSLCRFWEIFAGCLLAIYQQEQIKSNLALNNSPKELVNAELTKQNLQLVNHQEKFNLNSMNQYSLMYILINIAVISFVFVKKSRQFQEIFYVLWTVVTIKNKDTIFNSRFLSFQPLVFIGKISYSVYIWHQSVITIFRRGEPLLALSLAMIGVFTYYFIQGRIRTSKHPFATPAILIFGGIILILAFIIVSS